MKLINVIIKQIKNLKLQTGKIKSKVRINNTNILFSKTIHLF